MARSPEYSERENERARVCVLCVCLCVCVCVCEAPTSETYPDMETRGSYPEQVIR